MSATFWLTTAKLMSQLKRTFFLLINFQTGIPNCLGFVERVSSLISKLGLFYIFWSLLHFKYTKDLKTFEFNGTQVEKPFSSIVGNCWCFKFKFDLAQVYCKTTVVLICYRLNQGWAKYGPWAKTGPSRHYVRPAGYIFHC